MSKKITTELYVAECKLEHGELYDHSRVIYKSAKEKVEIICNKHKTSFWQEALSHKRGAGCPTCAHERRGGTQRTSQEDFIRGSIAADGNAYGHHLVVYKNSTTKVDIVCPKEDHGVFSMLPLNRLRGQQCPICAQETRNIKMTKTQEQFILDCEKHPDAATLDFTGTIYSGDCNRVTISCKEHGNFDVVASNFLQHTTGCPDCRQSRCGYRQNLPGYLYVLGTESGKIIKVGITNRTPEHRAREVSRSSGKKFKVFGHVFSGDGKIVRAKELQMHDWMQLNGKPVDEKFDGSTECFQEIRYGKLLCYMLGIQTSEAA